MRHRFIALIGVAGLIVVIGGVWGVEQSTGAGGHGSVELGAALQRSGTAVGPGPAKAPAATTYTFRTVRFPGSLGSEITGINQAGAYTGQVHEKTGLRSFIDSGRAGAMPEYFTVPKSYGTVQTAGIDDADEVIGNYGDAHGVLHGFIRTARGTCEPLNVLGAGTQKGEGTEVAGISPDGVIVGSYVGPDNVATGFIDRRGHITRVVQKAAGQLAGDGTEVDFYSNGEYGGVFTKADGSAHGWYEHDGQLYIVDDPVTGQPMANRGTQLVGVDASGRLYGIALLDNGMTESFWFGDGAFHLISDPHRSPSRSGTLALGVNASGTVVGFYDTAQNVKHGFIRTSS